MGACPRSPQASHQVKGKAGEFLVERLLLQNGFMVEVG